VPNAYVEIQNMGLLDELLHFMTSGSIGGLPPIVVMIIPLVVGLIVGFLVKKFLKIAVIAAIIIVVVSYLGFYGLSLVTLKDLADRYGPLAFHYGVLLIGILPLSIGFVIGLILGFLFG
jgi:uncharacterized membrane protein (Fun14 family)